MQETTMKRGFDIYAKDGNSRFSLAAACLELIFSSDVADGTGYDGHPMTFLNKVSGEFIMPGPTRFIQRSKSLMDQ